MESRPEINGELPDLAGRVCDDLCVQEFRIGEELDDPANMIFLFAEGVWWMICFDCGVVFSRKLDGPPSEDPGEGFRYQRTAAMLAAQGRRFKRMEVVDDGSLVSVILRVEGGPTVEFRHDPHADRTEVRDYLP